MLNCYRSTVKHGTQNIQNDCHQWLSDSFKVHQIRFRPRVGTGAPDPTGEAYSAPPESLAGLRVPTSKGERKGRGEREGPAPLSKIPGSAPVQLRESTSYVEIVEIDSREKVNALLTRVILRRHSTTDDCGSNVFPSTQHENDVAPSSRRRLGVTRRWNFSPYLLSSSYNWCDICSCRLARVMATYKMLFSSSIACWCCVGRSNSEQNSICIFAQIAQR